MGLVNTIRRGQAKAFNPELVVVLELLAGRGPLTLGEIADAVPAPRSSISRRLRALGERGWVAVERTGGDARSYSAVLTSEGNAELQRLRREGLEVFDAMVKDWTDDEIRAFAASARRLAHAVPPPTAGDHRARPWWKDDP